MKAITLPADSGADTEIIGSPRTLSGDAWRQFRKHKLAMMALAVLLLVIGLVMAGPLFWHTNPEYIDIIDAYSNMTAKHPFGTDNLGRDTLSRTIWGDEFRCQLA